MTQFSLLYYYNYNFSTGNGNYCGNSGLNMDPNNLYYCGGAGAVPSLAADCSFTCVTMPNGVDDKCSTSGTCSPNLNGKKGVDIQYNHGNEAYLHL